MRAVCAAAVMCAAVAGCTSKHTPQAAAAGAGPTASGTGASASNSASAPSLSASATASATFATSSGSIRPLPSFTFNLNARASAPVDHDVPIGQSVQDKEKGGTLTWRVNGIRFARTSADGVKTPDNDRYAVVDVTVTASGGAMDVDPASLTLQTSDDEEWTSYFTGALFPPQLKSRRLSPGQTARGNVTFDISNARVLRVALYTPSNATMGWRVS